MNASTHQGKSGDAAQAVPDRPVALDPEEERRHDAAGRHPPKKRLSEVLTEIAGDPSHDVITIGALMHLMEGRARAALILIFALPNALPAIPGTSGILGVPLLYLTSQMLMGRIPWLPRIIANRGLPRDKFALLVERMVPYLGRTERLLRPRWRPLSGHVAERFLGAICLVLAVVLTLPVPLGNMFPAFAICLIALGILERDGLWVVFGLIASAGALVVSAGVVYAISRAVLFVVLNAFAAEVPLTP
ncbi:MAG: exopolysaccharide biosynthesis protein [Rubellimicrobium sp.]|nr:exopolysaccharide biosynthesis protein [Rubellimicrobium sp.]